MKNLIAILVLICASHTALASIMGSNGRMLSWGTGSINPEDEYGTRYRTECKDALRGNREKKKKEKNSTGELTITCGEGDYDALAKDDLSLAEFSMVIRTRGADNPPELISLIDEGIDHTENARELRYSKQEKVRSASVNVFSGGRTVKYEMSGLVKCGDLESTTGEIVVSKYQPGGFNPWTTLARAKCKCRK